MNGQATPNKRRRPPTAITGGGSEKDSSSKKKMDGDSRAGSSNGSSSSNGPSMQLTSDEVNFLIFRYLQEAGNFNEFYVFCVCVCGCELLLTPSIVLIPHPPVNNELHQFTCIYSLGFVHSAFTFINESMISRRTINISDVPPWDLVRFLQKGLQYIGIEETIRQDGGNRQQREKGKGSKNSSATAATNPNNDIIDFSLLSPHTIKALIRRDPPIKLNVPPDAAAAAIRAKLEAESRAAKSQALVKNDSSSNNNNSSSNSSSNNNRRTQSNGPLATPQAAQIQQAPTAIQASTQNQRQQASWAQINRTQQAAQAMAMMNQSQMTNIRLPSNGYETGEQLSAAASAKAAAAQALASVAHIAVQNNGSKDPSSSMNIDMPPMQGVGTAPVVGNSSYNTNSGNNHVSSNNATALSNNMQLPQQEVRSNSLPQQQNEVEKDDMLTRARPEEVLELNKHTSEVFMCAWNPVFTNLLATGSGDASARIWQMGGQTAQSGSGFCRLLQHGNNSTDKKNKDVTTLEWSSDGELLATGSYDGVARVWRKDGSIVHTLCCHMGPIFSLKWNKRGDYLLSGSYDKTTIVWNVSGKKGVVKQQFHNHTAPALDVDWKDDETFASCSTDKSVLICKVGQTTPLLKFTGHKDEVNAVKWDPSGKLLASCSDDYTAKVWDVSNNSNQPLYDFKSHKQEIYTVKWYVLIII